LALIFIASSQSVFGQWLAGYEYRKPINIAAGDISGGPHTDFPVLVFWNSDTDLDDIAKTQANGWDIAFGDASGNQLDHELVSFDQGTGALQAWVKMDLPAAGGVTFYMYYGNTVVANPSTSNTWDSNYQAVLHLQESGNGSTDEFKDATSNARDGRGGSFTQTPSRVAGKWGFGQDFDDAGDDDYIIVKPVPDASWTEFTAGVWFNADDTEDDRLWGKNWGTDPNTDMTWVIRKSGAGLGTRVRTNSNSSGSYSPASYTTGNWTYAVVTWDGTDLRVYEDGLLEGTTALAGATLFQSPPTDDLIIGNALTLDRGFTGIIQEARISDVARSSGWIETQYNNQDDPGSFLTRDPEESCALASAPAPAVDLPTQDVCSAGTATINITGGDPAYDADTDYEWVAVFSSGSLSGTTSGTINADGSGNGVFLEIFNNSGTTVETVTLTFTPTDPTAVPPCSGNPVVATIDVYPVAQDRVIDPDNTTICDGETVDVTINASQTGVIYTLFKGGVPISSNEAGTGGALVITSNPITTNGAITVQGVYTSALNCTRTLGESVSVTVNANPIPVITGDDNVCQGATELYSTGPGSNYLWSLPSGGGTIIGGQGTDMVTVQWNTAGARILRVSYENGSGCSGQSDLPVTVAAPPSVAWNSISEEDGSNDFIICEGDEVTFDASSATAVNYVWRIGATIKQTGPSNTFTTTEIMDGDDVTVTVFNTAGCTQVLRAPTLPDNWEVNPYPTIDTQPTDEVACEGDDVTFTIAETGGDVIDWFVNGVSQGVDNVNFTISAVTIAGNDGNTIYATVTSPNGCETQSNTVSLSVGPIPSAAFLSSTECSGTATVFDASGSSVSSGSIVRYEWDFDNDLVYEVDRGPATNASFTFAGSGTYTVGLLITTDLGCTDVTTGIVTVNEFPVITVQPTDQVACEGSGATFNVTATGTGLSYQWRKNGVDIAGATGSSYTIASTASADAGTYTVIVDGTCGSPVTSNGVSLTIQEQPEVVTDPVSQTVCENTGVTFTVDAGVTTSPTYQWRKDGSNIVGATSSSYTIASTSPADAGNYDVVVSSGVGCGADAISAAATLTVRAIPTIVAGSGSFTVCANSSQSYSVPNVPGDSYLWSVVGGAIVSGAGTNTIVVLWGDTDPGQVSLVQQDGSTGCTLPTSETITIDPQPTLTVQSDDLICSDQLTYSIAGTGVTDGTISWASNTGGVFDNTGALDPTYTINATDLANGFVTLTATVTGDASCGAVVISDDVLITINEQPVANADRGGANPYSVCGLDFILDAVPSVSGSSGTWSLFSGPGTETIGNPNSPTTNVSVTDFGTYIFQWEETNGVCTDTDQISVTFNEEPTAIAGSGGDVCGLQFAFSATAPTVGIGTWSLISGSGNILSLDVNDPVSNVEVDAFGTYVFAWTVDNAGCIDVETVTVNFFQQPIANAGVDDAICALDYVLDATPSFGIGTWTISSKPGGAPDPMFNNINSPNATVTAAPGQFGDYTFRWTEVNGICNDFAEVTITFNETPTADAGMDETICSDGSTSLNGSATGGDGSYSYEWFPALGLNDPMIPNPVFTPNGSGTFSFTLTVTDGNGCVDTDLVEIDVNQVPSVTLTSSATQLCDVDQPVTFTAVATAFAPATSLNYDFYLDGVSVQNGASSTYEPTLTPGATYEVYVIVSDIGGNSCTTQSNSIDVEVNPNPVAAFTATDVCFGDVTTFDASGSTIQAGAFIVNYEWDFDNDNVFEFSSGTNNNTTFTFATAGNYTVNLRTTSDKGCVDVVQVTDILVNPTPDIVASGATICSGETTNIVFSNPNGFATGYSFVVKSSFNVTGETDDLGPGITGIYQQLFSADGSNPGSVTYTVTPLSGGCPGTPLDVVVNVNPIPNVLAADDAICDGGITFIPISNPNGVTGTVFNWAVQSTTGTVGASAGTGNVISQPLSLATANVAGQVVYRITPSASGCTGSFLDVTVDIAPVPDAFAPDQVICSGEMTSIPITNPNMVGGTTFNWTVKSSVNVSGATGDTGNLISQALSSTDGVNPGSITYEIVPTAGSCDGIPYDVSVTVNPVPDVAAMGVIICSDETTAIPITNPNGVTGTTFRWEIGSVNNVMGAANGSGALISQTLSTITSLSGSVDYTIYPAANGCEGSPITITVNVNPIPDAAASDQTICSGETTAIMIDNPNGVPGTQFDYFVINALNVTGASSSTGNMIAQTLTSTDGINPGVVDYLIIPSTGLCIGDAITVQAFVNPDPVVTVTNNTTGICSGENTNIEIETPTANGTVTIVSVTPSAPTLTGFSPVGAAFVDGAIVTDQLINSGNTVASIEYVFEVTANGCTGNQETITVTVDPIPDIATSVPAQTICNGETTNVTITNPNGVPGTVFNWTVTTTGGVTGATNDSGTTIAQTLSNPNPVAGTATYTITPTSSGCDGLPTIVIITVNPTPTMATTGDETLCSGESTNIQITNPNSVAGTTFSWTVQSVTNGIIGAADGGGSEIVQTLTNPNPNLTGEVVYRIRPSANGCDGAFEDVTVTVNSIPTVDAGPGFEICEDETIQLAASFGGSASSITWSGGGGAPAFSNVSDPSAVYTPTAADIANGSVTLTITTDDPDGAGPCTSAIDQVTFIINDLPLVSFSGLPTQIGQNGDPIPLNGFPPGGLFTGDGVSGNFFVPTVADLGDNFITYTYVSPGTGCVNSETQSIFVLDVPPVDIPGLDPERCENSPKELLVGSPPGGDFAIIPGVSLEGGRYFFDPAVAGSGPHVLEYTFTDANNVTNTALKTIIVTPTPEADFVIDNFCNDAPTLFTNTSTISTTVVDTAAISQWIWSFGDARGSTDENTQNQYDESGQYTVRLTVASNSTLGCSDSKEETIFIGTTPVPDFSFGNICNNDFTSFSDLTTTEGANVDSYQWDFNDGNVIGPGPGSTDATESHPNGAETIGTLQNPEHRYALGDIGSKQITLSVTTDAGCIADTTKSVDILEYITVNQFPYIEDFEASDGEWAELPDQIDGDISWGWTSQTSFVINSKPPPLEGAQSNENIWLTRNDNITFYPDEKSYVNGPCFDLTQLDRPFVEFDYWVSTDEDKSGSHLEYSVDGSTWSTLGGFTQDNNELDRGIAWYSSESIVGLPLSEDRSGWSGQSEGWQNARYVLDDIKDQDQVRFRFVFGANSDPVDSIKFSGFAFDNFKVKDRERNVLLEHFTNNQDVNSISADNFLYQIIDEQAAEGVKDFSHIQFHRTLNDLEDPFYQNSSVGGIDARTFENKINAIPYAVIDGNVFSGGYVQGYDLDDIQNRALEDPAFEITNLQETPNSQNNENIIEVSWTVTPLRDFEEVVSVFVAVIEKGVDDNGRTLRNVFRSFVPDAAGTTIGQDGLSQGQSYSDISGLDKIQFEIANRDSVALMVWVQGKPGSGFEVYQMEMLDLSPKEGDIPTGLEEELKAEIETIDIYPNPVAGDLYFKTQNELYYNYNWKIIDQRGVTLKQGDFRFEDSKYSVDTRDIRNGMYFLVIGSGDKPLVYKKIVIVHK